MILPHQATELNHQQTDPQLAASTMAMQNASVREVLRKMSPCTKTWSWYTEIYTNTKCHGIQRYIHIGSIILVK